MSSTIPAPDVLTHVDLSGNLDSIFQFDPAAWAPRPDVYAQALEAAMATGSALPSNQAVYAALRRRGFIETKIDGVYGFRGIAPAWSKKVIQRHHHTPGSPIHPAPWLAEQRG